MHIYVISSKNKIKEFEQSCSILLISPTCAQYLESKPKRKKQRETKGERLIWAGYAVSSKRPRSPSTSTTGLANPSSFVPSGHGWACSQQPNSSPAPSPAPNLLSSSPPGLGPISRAPPHSLFSPGPRLAA